MNKFLSLILISLAPSAMAASLPQKLDCTIDGSQMADFTLTKQTLGWRIDYLNGSGKSDYHYHFENISLRPNMLFGFYLSSSKKDVGGYLVKVRVIGSNAANVQGRGMVFPGSIKVKMVPTSGNEQQRQELQDESFSCVATQ